VHLVQNESEHLLRQALDHCACNLPLSRARQRVSVKTQRKKRLAMLQGAFEFGG
jgi:hypothetical protein